MIRVAGCLVALGLACSAFGCKSSSESGGDFGSSAIVHAFGRLEPTIKTDAQSPSSRSPAEISGFSGEGLPKGHGQTGGVNLLTGCVDGKDLFLQTDIDGDRGNEQVHALYCAGDEVIHIAWSGDAASGDGGTCYLAWHGVPDGLYRILAGPCGGGGLLVLTLCEDRGGSSGVECRVCQSGDECQTSFPDDVYVADISQEDSNRGDGNLGDGSLGDGFAGDTSGLPDAAGACQGDQDCHDGLVCIGKVCTIDPTVVSAGSCLTCTGDEGCDPGLKCLPVGASKHCLLDCTTDGDCPRSYICYAASSSNKSCLPVSYACPPCAADAPCEAGKVCDMLVSGGTCKVGNPECGSCTYDFDCAAGMRCYKKTGSAKGVCVAGCSDAKPCSGVAKFSCEASEKGVKMCKPLADDSCLVCPPEKPFLSNDGLSCWQCLNNSQCTVVGETCNAMHVCAVGGCSKFTCDDGNCHDCCSDSDCPNSTGPCTNYQCVNQVDPCNGTCLSPYPICAEINATLQCVQCKETADCAGQGSGSCTCTGDPTYSCIEPDGNVCQSAVCGAVCQTEVDCPPDANGASLACTGGAGGICYNPTGACDGVSSCCVAGASCYDVMSAIMGGLGGIPGGTTPAINAYCSCTDAIPCLGGKPCTATAGMCTFPLVGETMCPGGIPPATMPEKLCMDIAEMLTGILGGI